MKHFLFIVAVLFGALALSAQYYNPYNNQAYNMGRAMALVDQGKEAIVNGDYEEAVAKFEEAYELNFYPAAECLGLCYELGIGVDRDEYYANLYYEDGAEHGNADCRRAINRINNHGHYTEAHRATWLRNFRAYYQAQYPSAGYAPAGGYNSGTSGSSSGSGRTCVSCNGTGRCNTCNGQGWYYHETGYYTGNSHQTRTTCPVCNGTGRCGTCRGQGSIR